MNNELYSIGDISTMFNISIQTIRYYEKIGLFVPAKKSEETGYRYYTWNQFERLRLIIHLKDLGMSLKDIKHQLDTQRGEEYLNFLESYSALLDRRIQSDTQIKRYIDLKIESMKQAYEMPQNKTLFLPFAETRILKYESPANSFHEHERAFVNFLRKFHLKTGISRIGQYFSPNTFDSKNGLQCTGLFATEDMFTEETEMQAGDAIITIPKGTYAVIYYRKPTEETLPYLYQLLDEVEHNSFEPCGDIYRTITSDVGRGHPEDDGYQALLRILVKKKQES
jgi:DNA-binding transcriptional MerR regulator